jgi:hypothetical protein
MVKSTSCLKIISCGSDSADKDDLEVPDWFRVLVFSAQISFDFFPSSNQLQFDSVVRFGFDAFGVTEEQLVLCLET